MEKKFPSIKLTYKKMNEWMDQWLNEWMNERIIDTRDRLQRIFFFSNKFVIIIIINIQVHVVNNDKNSQSHTEID